MTHDPKPTTPDSTTPEGTEPIVPPHVMVAARREKMRYFKEELGFEPYGSSATGLLSCAEARSKFSEASHAVYELAAKAAKAALPAVLDVPDTRLRAKIAGRVVQHRDMGKLVFLFLRDATGEIQVSISKSSVQANEFELAKAVDYGDILIAEGPVGRTQKGEVCIWAAAVDLGAKSLAPPPEKWHGLSDPELRYRRRYVDMYANPQTTKVFAMRSKIISRVRRFMEAEGFLEVETPMLQPIAGGAAARPFLTQHNALGMPLFLRIAPELYLKRCLVGGMRKVFEINRNFRNEGIDRSHNPEFTAMEAYEAFGDSDTMMTLTESLLHMLACEAVADRVDAGLRATAREDGRGPILPFGELDIDYSAPFVRVSFAELFEKHVGCDVRDFAKVRAKAREIGLHHEAKLDDWLVVNAVFEEIAEPRIDPCRPTFVTDWPSAISPLTRPHRHDPDICGRWDLFIGGMEIGPAYTELNDPDIQLAKFTEQLRGEDEEVSTFRSLDEDFVESLRVGMPPAGGLGLGIDRIVMLLTDSASIRDVILFPLLKSMGAGNAVEEAPRA
ncbi:MAG: lysine--tRNA ligase [Phycisphaerales bacterium]|nr:lysine--tRNA ligase [Phycisphaerales bacterium]